MSIDTVSDLAPRVQYIAGVSQQDFDYPFPIFEDADLVVDVDGTTQALTTDYVVSDAGADTGGQVMFVDALVGGEIVTIHRDMAIERTTDFSANGAFSSSAFNDEFDRLTLVQQQLKSETGRALRFPQNAEIASGQLLLTPFSSWKGKYLRFNTTTGIPEPASSTGAADGAGGISVVFSREYSAVPADSNGANPVLTNTGTAIRVYEGATELSYVTGTPGAGEWAVSAAATGLTAGSISDAGDYATVADHAAPMSGDTAYVAYTITGKTVGAVDFALLKYQTFTKAKAGVDGADSQMYYIRPTAGTAIKNGAGTLSLQSRSLLGGVDSALAAGTIQLYAGSTLVTVANGFASGSDGYVGYFDSGDIASSVTVYLRDGPAGTIYDTITLADIADGAADTGSDAVYGYVEASNGLAFTRASDGSTWAPAGATTRLDCTFVQAGTEVAREAWLITRASDGTLTGVTTTHGGGDLNTSRVTVTEINSGTRALTVRFDYSFGGDEASVGETVLTSLSGTNGSTGSSGTNALTISATPDARSISCTANGTVNSGELPYTITSTVYSGSTNVTTSATWGTPVTSNCNVTDNSNGSVTINSVTADSGYVEVAATYGGATVTKRCTWVKVKAGTASQSVQDLTLSMNNANTHPSLGTGAVTLQQGGAVTLPVGPDGTVTLSLNHNITTGGVTTTLYGKLWYRATVGSGAWTQVGAEETDSGFAGGEETALSFSRTGAGPASAAVWEFVYTNARNAGTCTSGTGNFNVSWSSV